MESYLKEARPALLLCDFMNYGCLDVAHMLKLPMVVTIPFIDTLDPGLSAPYVLPWHEDHRFGATTEHMNVVQRMYWAVIRPAIEFARLAVIGAVFEAERIRLGIDPILAYPATRWRNSLKLVSTFWGFEVPRAVDPTYKFIGPIETRANTQLSPELEAWLAGRSRVVYVAMGQWCRLSPQEVAGMVQAFNTLLTSGKANGVIWSVSAARQAAFEGLQLHPDILLQPWVAQKGLLRHPAVRAFVSHGGVESAHEAISAKVPLVLVCFMVDQCTNAAKLVDAGMAVALTKVELRSGGLVTALIKVLQDEGGSYAAATARLHALASISGKHGVEAGADLLEYSIYYGWQQLTPPSYRMNALAAANVDAWLLAAVLALAAALVLRQLLGSWLTPRAAAAAARERRAKTE